MRAPKSYLCSSHRGRKFWRLPSGLLALIGCSLSLGEAPEPLLEIAPHAPISGDNHGLLFTLLAAETSGITYGNPYDDPRMWGERYQEFSVGAIGTGIAVSDFDRDGLPDVFVVSKTRSSRLYRNLGNWKFEDVSQTAGVADTDSAATVWKTGATFADVDNDGWPDLLVCRVDAPNLFYHNQGDGTFREEGAARGLDQQSASSMAAFADYDRDGWLDLYLQTNLLDARTSPNGEPDVLLRNTGDGKFTESSEAAGILDTPTQGHSATWWDFNDDGWPDLYVANDFSTPDFLYQNNHDGTFSEVINRTVPHQPFSSMGADLGDVDNDGRIDFLVTDMAATTREKDQRGMADSRVRSAAGRDPSTASPQYLRNALYLNTGTGPMREGAIMAGLEATDWTWSPRWEDLDNDGRLDLHVTNGMNREQHNTDLLTRMMTAETPISRVRLMRESPVLNEPNLAYQNLGQLNFKESATEWGLEHVGVSFGSAFADFDRDGDLDLIYSNFDAPPSLYRNDSREGHRLTIALRGSRSNHFGIGAKATIETRSGRQVRYLTLARGYQSSSEPIIHFGLGADEQVDHLTIQWPSGQVQRFQNLLGNRHLIIREPASTPPSETAPEAMSLGQFSEVAQLIGFRWDTADQDANDAFPQPLLSTFLDRRGPALAAGDLTGNGLDDFVMGGTPSAPAALLVTSPTGAMTSVSLEEFSANALVRDGPVIVFDANGDDRSDILITRGGANLPVGSDLFAPKLILNNGRGLVAADHALSYQGSAGAVAVADFDRDGRLDLFIGGRVSPGEYPQAPLSALFRNQGDRFEAVTSSVAPGLEQTGMITAALWTDIDGDGWIDLLLAREWDTLQFWRNHDGKFFVDESEIRGFSATGSGWWNSVASGDFNEDGRPDYVVGNRGLNTAYQANDRVSSVLLSIQLDRSEDSLLIEAINDGNRLWPRATRRELSRHLRSIRREFPTNNDYARASLDEILGEKELAMAGRWEATESQSGLLLSQSDGTHRFSPLPRIAQISPMRGAVVGDFNGDGHADLYTVQNADTAAPSIGRYDGGVSQLMHGQGDGRLSVVSPQDSGLVVTGNAAALITTDTDADGWPDFLVTRSDGPALAFKNHGISNRRMTSIALHGPVGNPTAIGARIIIHRENGAQQLTEFSAGSGYLSQSAARMFVAELPENPVKEITVHWPDGVQSSHQLSYDVSQNRFTHPLRR